MTKSERNKQYYLKNKEKFKEYNKIYYASNKSTVDCKNAEYRKVNKEKLSVYHQQYRQQNIKKFRKYNLGYYHGILKTDLHSRIAMNLRSRLRNALKHNKKLNSAIELLGCSVEELRIYLKNKFTDGMTWENYGTWHIDHIKPCALFNLTQFEEQQKCFHYTNLQPLWKLDNLIKHAKYEPSH